MVLGIGGCFLSLVEEEDFMLYDFLFCDFLAVYLITKKGSVGSH
jgi:hypothetical protein